MTESEWLECTDPIPMLEFLKECTPNRRKLRLFGAACCRRAWHKLDADARAAVEMSERFADGLADEEELMAAVWANRGQDIAARAAVDDAAIGALRPAVALLADVCCQPPSCPAGLAQEQAAQASLLRDSFGNPFRPPALPPGVLDWHDGLVEQLAQSVYDDCLLPSGHLRTDRLSVLADALLDAGCTDTDLLDHLRAPGPHCRACFVVDLLLGKRTACLERRFGLLL